MKQDLHAICWNARALALGTVLAHSGSGRTGPSYYFPYSDQATGPSCAFAGSSTLLTLQGGLLRITNATHRNWTIVDQVGHNISSFELDENNPGFRAFAFDGTYARVFQTMDQGRTWTQMTNKESFWDSAEDKNNPKVRLNFHVQTNAFALEDILVTVVRCESITKEVSSCEASTSVFVSVDGKHFHRRAKIKAPDGCPISYRCYFSGSDAGARVICELRVLLPSSKGGFLGQDVGLFYSDNHGKTFVALEEFKRQMVWCLQAIGNFSTVITVKPKKWYRTEPSFELWMSRDGSRFERVDQATSRRMPMVESLDHPFKRQLVRLRSVIDGQLTETILVANSHGPYLKYLVRFRPNTQTASLINGLSDSVTAILHPLKTFPHEMSVGLERRAISTSDASRSFRLLNLHGPARELVCNPKDNDDCYFNLLPPEKSLLHEFPGAVALVGTVAMVGGPSRSKPEPITFVTRDSGRTWHKLLDFPALVAFGDHDNVVVAVPSRTDSESPLLYYSTDRGNSWSLHRFEKPIKVLSISRASADISSAIFIMSAKSAEDGHRRYAIDFSDVIANAQQLNSYSGEASGSISEGQKVTKTRDPVRAFRATTSQSTVTHREPT
ncbi:Vacuolar protein sorting/targeting protein 10 [Lachancea thermotolerans]